MNGCSWCDKFKPIWEQLRKETNYKFYECVRDNIKYSKQAQKIQSQLDMQIKSFPAIFIRIGKDYYKYEGERSLEAILNFVGSVINKKKYLQNGGIIDYRNKYKKYKTMYLEILEKYNKIKINK
jgi:hypothetical protein